MRRRFAAPFAEFFQFDLALHHFLVFVGVIILPFADGAAEGNEGVGTLYFCHAGYDIMARGKMQRRGAWNFDIINPWSKKNFQTARCIRCQ